MFFIDTLSEIPIYTQICNGIIKEIAEGNLKNGDSLPSVRQFAKDFNVNPMTVNKAYGILKNENIIEIDRRNGSVICVKCEKKHLKEIDCGYSFDADDVEGAYNAILSILENQYDFAAKGIKGLEYFNEHYTLGKCIDNLENIINEVKARGLSKEDLFNIIERSFQC